MICDCGKQLGKLNKSGMCKICHCRYLNTSPEMAARRSAALKDHYNQPGVRERRRRSLLVAMANLSPQERLRRSEHGKEHARNVLHSPEVLARTFAPDVIAQRGRSHTETRLGWCPPEMRDHYRYLIQTKHILAVDAKQIILDEIEAEKRRADAAMTPLERQCARLRAGASLVPTFRPSKPDPDMTLGGVASGML